MSNYNSLKATINANIRTNGNEEITGSILNAVLTAIVDSLGAGYQFMGVATPSTNPGTPDQRVLYFASEAGTYVNFSNLFVNNGELALLCYDNEWTKSTIPVSDVNAVHFTQQTLTDEQKEQARQNIGVSIVEIVDNLTSGGRDKALSAEQGKILKDIIDYNNSCDEILTLTTESLFSNNKKMVNQNGVLTFQSSTTGRRIFRFDFDNFDGVALSLPSVQRDNGSLVYAFTDDNDNIIFSSSGGTTSNTNINIIKSLNGVKYVYISKSSSSTSADIKVVKHGVKGIDTQELIINRTNCISFLGNGIIVNVDGKVDVSSSSTTKSICVGLIHGMRTLEGYTYANQGAIDFAITDKYLNIILSHNCYTAYAQHHPLMDIPEDAYYIVYSDKQSATETSYNSQLYFTNGELYKHIHKILLVGNSFTQCYWNFVPYILKNIFGEDHKWVIMIGMVGSSDVANWNNWLNNSGNQNFSILIHDNWYAYDSGRRYSGDILQLYDWDCMGMQQRSVFSGNYSTWRNIWGDVIAKISSQAKRAIKVFFTMVHAVPTSVNVADSDTRMEEIFAAHRQFQAEFPVDIIPVGTAIQNARHTPINNIAWTGSYGQLTPDNMHLQSGFACLIGAWAIVQYLCRLFGSSRDVTGDITRVDASFMAEHNMLIQYGNAIFAENEDQNMVAQKCVLAASYFPFEIKENIVPGE